MKVEQVVEERQQRLVRPVVVALAPAGDARRRCRSRRSTRGRSLSRDMKARRRSIFMGLVLCCQWFRREARAGGGPRLEGQGCSVRERLCRLTSSRFTWENKRPASASSAHKDALRTCPRHRSRRLPRSGSRRCPRWGTARRTPRRYRRRGRVASGTLRNPFSDLGCGITVCARPSQSSSMRSRMSAVRDGGQHVQRGVFRHGARASRNAARSDVVGLGHRRDLLHLRDAAGAPGVGLDHVDQLSLDQLAHAEDRGLPLARRQRHAGMRRGCA